MLISIAFGSKADFKWISLPFCIYTILSNRPLLVLAINQSVGGFVLRNSRLSINSPPTLLAKQCSTSFRTIKCLFFNFSDTLAEMSKFCIQLILHSLYIQRKGDNTNSQNVWGNPSWKPQKIANPWPGLASLSTMNTAR